MRQINQTRTSHKVKRTICGREYTVAEELTRNKPCSTSQSVPKNKEGKVAEICLCTGVQGPVKEPVC